MILSTSVGILDTARLFVAKLQLCSHIIEIQVHQGIISICLESHYESWCPAHLPIPFSTETLQAILSSLVRIWDMAHVLVSQPQLLLAYDWRSGAPERVEYIFIWLIDHWIFANPSGNKLSLCATLSTFGRIWDTSLLIRGKATPFTSLRSKYWCTGGSWVYRYDRSSTA